MNNQTFLSTGNSKEHLPPGRKMASCGSRLDDDEFAVLALSCEFLEAVAAIISCVFRF
jgi:hypothetical protein